MVYIGKFKFYKPGAFCCVCNSPCGEGSLIQKRMYELPNGKMQTVTKYMCKKCKEKGEAWTGWRPGKGIPLKEALK
jgi:hypothetical protein